MERPITIWLILALGIVAGGCRPQAELTQGSPRTSALLVDSFEGTSATRVTLERTPEFTFTLPMDADARSRGFKVFAKQDALLYRSPRASNSPTYQIGRGSAMYVRPDRDPKWLQVQLSKGRTAYVKADTTTADIAALMVQSLAPNTPVTKARVAPKTEPDTGDQNGGNAGDKNAELVAAIEKVQTALTTANEELERLRADVDGFQGASTGWPMARDSALTSSATFANNLQRVTTAMTALASESGSMSTNIRSAFQSAVQAEADASQALTSLRQTLNQMEDGADWTAIVPDAANHMIELGNAMQSLSDAVRRL